MTSPSRSDELDPTLAAAEEELLDLVEEACRLEPPAPGAGTTGELRRLEQALQRAARAAERALTLRRQKGIDCDDKGSGGPAPAEAEVPIPGHVLAFRRSAGGVREFEDASGRAWRAWAVKPSRRGSDRGPLEQLRPEYREGWLTFESMDGALRCRLPQFPEDWVRRSDEELTLLLTLATPVAARPKLTAADQGELSSG